MTGPYTLRQFIDHAQHFLDERPSCADLPLLVKAGIDWRNLLPDFKPLGDHAVGVTYHPEVFCDDPWKKDSTP